VEDPFAAAQKGQRIACINDFNKFVSPPHVANV
jgi:hypothetical protein